MPAPNLLVCDIKGAGTSIGMYLLRGGLFREAIGAAITSARPTTAQVYANKVVRYRGELYCFVTGYIRKYDPDTDTWPHIFNLTSYIGSTGNWNFAGGFLEYMPANRSETMLGFIFMTVNAIPYYRALGYCFTADGVTWNVTYSLNQSSALAPGHGLMDFNGSVYARNQGNGWSYVIDGTTGLFTTMNYLGIGAKFGQYFILDDRLFYISPQSTNGPYTTNGVEELVLGSWVARLVGSTKFGSNTDGSNCSAMRYGEDVVVFGPWADSTTTGAKGLACVRYYVNAPGGALQFADASVAVLPAAIRHDAATSGTVTSYRGTCFVDTETDPANPKHYFMFQPGSTSEAVTLFQFNGFSSPLTVVGSPQADGDYAFPSLFFGGGGSFNGIGGNTPMISGRIREANKGLIGLELVYELRGDQTRLDHGTVTSGPFTVGETVTGGSSGATGVVDYQAPTGLYLLLDEGISATPFDGGEVITGGSSGASATLETVLPHGLVTGGPFEATQSILGGTSGATAVITEAGLGYIKVDTVVGGPFSPSEAITQTSGPNTGATAAATSDAPLGHTGGAEDKIVQFRYYYGAGGEGQGSPGSPAVSGLCTLVPATLQGGGTLISGNTQISDVAAADRSRAGDPAVRSVEWNFLADGLPEGLVDRIQLEAIRP